MAKSRAAVKTGKQPLRFAHPFFTTPPAQAVRGATAPPRMLDHIAANLQKIPAPRRAASSMTLADIIGKTGADEIVQSGSLTFQTMGDSGRRADSPQGDVARAMASDFNVSKPSASPAFLLHLGDVIYGTGKDGRYRQEFYEPYVHYPGKIIAIPGNHDGEVFAKTDPKSLAAFLANFCASSQSVPAVAGTIYRETMNQPGVFWLMDSPLVQVVGLYSNAAENPGFISGGAAGTAQKTWLIRTLTGIATARKNGNRAALILAMHHPPFTSGGHSPSTEMLADLDDACTKAGVMPDMVLSGHAHSYQRYTRRVPFKGQTLEIPYLVVGTGGISDQAIAKATGQLTGDHTFVQSRKGFGYLNVTATQGRLAGVYIAVDGDNKAQFDRFSVALATSRVS